MTPITTIEQLIARFENSTLDYKTTYDLTEKATRYEIAKDVAAFANAFGGSIVVGVFESGGKAVRLDGVPNLAQLTEATSTALQQYCAPVPWTPDEHAIPVSPGDARRLLASSAAPPSADLTLVTLNVRADPRGPVGVKLFDKKTEQPIDHAYRFPVRIDDQTRFLDPTELPMWMNSHERRVAIFLRKAQEAGKPHIRVHCRRGVNQQQPYVANLVLSAVDEAEMHATLCRPDEALCVNVPFTFILSVWREVADKGWEIAVNGSLFTGQNPYDAPRFRPYLGGA